MSEEKGRDENQWCLHDELIVQCHKCLSNMLIVEKVEVSALKAKLAQYERPFDEAEVQEAAEYIKRGMSLGHIVPGDRIVILEVALRRESAAKEAAERELSEAKAALVNPEYHWRQQWEIQSKMAAQYRDERDRLQQQVFNYAKELQAKEDLRLTNVGDLQEKLSAKEREAKELREWGRALRRALDDLDWPKTGWESQAVLDAAASVTVG